MTLRTLVLLALGICLWAPSPSSANAQSGSDFWQPYLAQFLDANRQAFLASANYYDKLANEAAARGDHRTAQGYRTAANQYRQLVAQLSDGRLPATKPPQQPPQQRQDNSAQIQREKDAVNSGAFGALITLRKWSAAGLLRNKRWVKITWRPGPTDWGQGFGATRSSTVSVVEARGYINMLSNNRHLVTGLQAF